MASAGGVDLASAPPHADSRTVVESASARTTVAIDARRGQVYLQVFDGGHPLMAPDVLSIEAAAARLAELWGGGPATVVGPGAALLAGVLPLARLNERAAPDPGAIARLAARAKPPFPPPRPLYLRAPDARLAAP